MRILVSIDGSLWGRRGLQVALRLFSRTAHEITVLIFRHVPSKMGDRKAAEIVRGTQEKREKEGVTRPVEEIAREATAMLNQEGQLFSVNVATGEGDMVDQVLNLAADFDLVCLSGAGRGGFSQQLLGVTAERLVLTGHGNLMITKGRQEPHQKVLLCPSLLAGSRGLGEYAGRLLAGTDVHISVLGLFEEPSRRFDGYRNVQKIGQPQAGGDSPLPDFQFAQKDRSQRIVDDLLSYELSASLWLQGGATVKEVVTRLSPEEYDLVILEVPPDEAGGLQEMEREKRMLELVRSCAGDVILLRRLESE